MKFLSKENSEKVTLTSESQYFPFSSFFTSWHATVCGIGSVGNDPVVMVSKW